MVITMEDIVAMIQSVGFPVVCTIMLAYLLIVENRQHKEEMNSLPQKISGFDSTKDFLKHIISLLKIYYCSHYRNCNFYE